MVKAYGIFSGGLDSILAAKLLLEQDIDVHVVTFITPFFGADRAVASARSIGLEPVLEDLTTSHMQMLISPKHGYGRFMNPCIDCHALMFRQAGNIMKREGGDFLFSGEVLGQRPKSQNRRALDIVARDSGFAEYILRPLSAKALPRTKMEEEGLVDRERLLGFSGRTRKPQIELAARYGITDYPAPAGGCLLTDPIFSRRLEELSARRPDPSLPPRVRDVELLKWGRHFRLPGGSKLVVGRNQLDNEAIEGMIESGDLVLKVAARPGPTVLLTPPPGRPVEDASLRPDLEQAAVITASYSDAPDGESVEVRLIVDGQERKTVSSGVPKNEFSGLMI